MSRITFERVSNRANYTHFVEANGDLIALASLHELKEFRVGVVIGQEFPTDQQRQSIAHLANLATGVHPQVEILFSEGCSPFPGAVPSRNPFCESCTT